MPQKYIDMIQQIPNWIPFIGLATGKSPLPTRFVEAAILALVPIMVGAIWMVPKIEAKLETMGQVQTTIMSTYSENMKSLSGEVKENNQKVTSMQTDIAVLKNNVSRMEAKVDDIDQIANTKVRSIEGRIDSLEKEVTRNGKN